MSLSETRFGANATGLPAVLPSLTSALSRRAALFGAVTVASCTAATSTAFTASVANETGRPAAAQSAALSALVSEFDTVFAEAGALLAQPCHRSVDCDEVPGWPERQARIDELVAAMYEARAESLADVVLIARFLQAPVVNENYRAATDLGYNLADDILRLHAQGALS